MERWAKGLNAAKAKTVSAPAVPKAEEEEGVTQEAEFKMVRKEIT